MKLRPLLSLAALLVIFLPAIAEANLEQDILNVSNGLSQTFGGGGVGAGLLNNLLIFLSNKIILLAGIAATFIIVKAGLSLINSQADDKLAKAKREIGTAIVAIVLGYLSERFVEATYGGGTAIFNPAGSVAILETEAAGIINFVLELVVIIGIIMIIYTAVKVVSSFGKDDGPAEIRKSVFGVVSGLVLLTSANAIQQAMSLNPNGVEQATGPVTAQPLATRVLEIISDVMSYLAILGVGMVIFAGIRMIVSIGNDDEYNNAKQLVFRVLMGLTIVLFAYTVSQVLIRILKGEIF